ncbi:MAG TPA: MFS transporter [Methanobacterium sp.]|nr:MFS transporter [Methanobacterium sp.]
MEGPGTTDDYRKKWRVLLAVSIGTMMVPINSSITNVSLPTIASFFAVNVATAEWVLTSYLIMFIGLVLFFARFGDFYGHEKLFFGGLIGFVISSLLCSLSPSIMALIIFRGVQGVTGAMVLSVSMVIIEKSFPLRYLGKAFGIYSVAIAAGLTMGPAIGGIMDSLFGWRSIFLINVPIGIMAFTICYFTLKRGKSKKVKWDIPGTILQFTYFLLLIYSLNLIEESQYTTAAVTGFFSAVAFILFVNTELKSKNPMMKLQLFKNKIFSAFNISLHFNYICMYLMLFVMPFYLQKVLHLNSGVTGTVLTASPIVMMLMASVSGSMSDRLGSRIPVFFGSVICMIAMLLMTQLTTSSTTFDVFWRLALLGLGAALFQAPANKTLMSTLPSENAGMASGVIATVRNMGMVFAVCYGGLLIHSAISPQLMLQDQLFAGAAVDLTEGIHRAVIFGAILSALMAILSFAGLKNKKAAVVNYENVIKHKKSIFEKRTKKYLENVLNGASK